MKTLYTFLVFIFLLTTAKAQEITATLSGNTASDGFSVKNMAGTTRFRVNAVGGVGIGTTSPQNLLDIEGSMVIGAGYSGTNAAPANGLLVQGNVGIGTTNPNAKLEVAGDLIVTSNFFDGPANNFFEGGCGDNQHVTGISSSGNITCGSNSGDISGVTAGFGLNGGGTTGTPTLSLDLASPNTWGSTQTFNANTNFPGSGIWNTTGKVGIGTTSPGNILTIQQTSSTDPIADAWTTYSSRRWKENIKPLEGALDKVMQLQGVSYDLKADGKHDIGLIAEEVGEVIPEVVVYEENGIDAQSVDYARLVSVLIEAVKEQQKQIETLKRKFSSLTLKEIDRSSYGYTKTKNNK